MKDVTWGSAVDTLTAIFHFIGGYIWGPALLWLLVGTGLFLTCILCGVQFRMLPYALKLAFSRNQDDKSTGDISQFQSLMTSLAATIGTAVLSDVDWLLVASTVALATAFSVATSLASITLTSKPAGPAAFGPETVEGP